MKCTTFILKVASRCNLNCDYCYVYNAGDNTYLTQPKKMSEQTIIAFLEKVKEHGLSHDTNTFDFIFHGGEPLLLPPQFYQQFVALSQQILPNFHIGYALQTNGVLINRQWCETFEALQISVGISIDPTEKSHNEHRVFHNGKGSFEATKKGLVLLKHHRLPYSVGILMVMDIKADPHEVYQFMQALEVKAVNLLFPYANYEQLPPHITDTASTVYADWLIAIFDDWFDDNSSHFKIKIFEQIMELILGIDNGFEYWGQRPNEYLVIETDGSIEVVGALKLCGHGFTKAGMNVHNHTFDETLATPLVQHYQLSHQKTCQTCKQCEVFNVCGGGFFPNRYQKTTGFDNPSVYCASLFKLIKHIQQRMYADMPETLQSIFSFQEQHE